MPVNVAGTTVFGPAGSDIFSTLASISADLKSNNTTQLSTDAAALQPLTSGVADAQAVVGSRYNQLQSASSALTSNQTSLQTNLAAVVDVDFAKATTDFQLQQTVYQAALKATSMIIQPSLASFLA